MKLITDSIRQNKKVVEVSDKDFKNIDYSKETQPDSYSIMFKILNAHTNKIEIDNVGGSSAVNILGRFAGGNEQLENIIKQVIEFEQKCMPDKILAEIVHLPESRTGNILARPVFRTYEIPYLAKGAVDDHFQIKMEDLFLKVRNNKIILFDKRLKKEIIPRMSNAHNFTYNSLPVYYFLCDIQAQYFTKPHIGFNWGILANQFSFLPRVEYQNTVLSLAKWQLNRMDLEPIANKNSSHEEKQKAFAELKNRIELPDKFMIADGDNELLIDCSNPTAISVFIETVKNRYNVTLKEYLFDDKQALVKDSYNNSYTNECIAIVLNEKEPGNLNSSDEEVESTEGVEDHVFSAGSEWLYYKIYCGSKTVDYILTEKLKNIAETLLEMKLLTNGFLYVMQIPKPI